MVQRHGCSFALLVSRFRGTPIFPTVTAVTPHGCSIPGRCQFHLQTRLRRALSTAQDRRGDTLHQDAAGFDARFGSVTRSMIMPLLRRLMSRVMSAPSWLERPSMTTGPGFRRSRWPRAVATTSSGVRILPDLSTLASVPIPVVNPVSVAPGQTANAVIPVPRSSIQRDSLKLSTKAFAALYTAILGEGK